MNTIATSTLKLKLLKVVFEAEIQAYEIPAFRGAIAQKVGYRHLLFHNHQGKGYRYAYPLIQYKRMHRQAAILCIGEGVDHIHHYFEQKDWSIDLSSRRLNMAIDRLDMNQFRMQVWDQSFVYRIQNWIALNQQNWQAYQLLQELPEQQEYLRKKLIGNILSFAKGIGWHVDKPIELEIQEIYESRLVKVKGVYLNAFNLRFRTNVFLPNYIGLGKNVSLGYGVVRQPR